MATKEETIKVDGKTEAVFKKKGYVVLKRIAGGAFGDVYKARNVKRDELNAVKVMNLDRVAKAGLQQEYLDREIKALASIQHPNVLKVNDIFRAKGRLYIFMEFAPNGTLTNKIEQSPSHYLSERRAKHWFKQCVEALFCMHVQHHMAHRDIKPDNVLFDADDNAKLSDFGFAREWKHGESDLSRTYLGTLPYYAPQVLAKKPYNPFLYDTWSMGVMLFLMLNGRLPFKISKEDREGSLRQMKQKAYRINKVAWAELSDEVKDLIDIMFIYDEDNRANIIRVRQHPWFRS